PSKSFVMAWELLSSNSLILTCSGIWIRNSSKIKKPACTRTSAVRVQAVYHFIRCSSLDFLLLRIGFWAFKKMPEFVSFNLCFIALELLFQGCIFLFQACCVQLAPDRFIP